MAPPTAVLSLISPRTALHLLLKCYNLRPAYLLRTIANITDIDVFASHFDTSICEAVAAVLQTTPSNDFKTRCYLPRKFGGLGLSRHHGMATEKSQILSRLAFLDFHHPPEHHLLSNHYNRGDIRLGRMENLEDHTGLDEDKILTLINPSAKGILSAAKTLAYQKQCDDTLSLLADFPHTHGGQEYPSGESLEPIACHLKHSPGRTGTYEVDIR